MDRFPALSLILRHGRKFAAMGAVGVTVMLELMLTPVFGGYALLVVPVLFPFAYVLVKSYVEMVQIVTEMVH